MNNYLLRTAMLFYRHRYWRPVERMSHHPAVTQQALLKRLFLSNRHTRFGQEHKFDKIDNFSQLQENIPIQNYETLRPYIEEQRRTGKPVLTTEKPICYSQTSGSSGLPKHIPITATASTIYQQEQALFSYLQYRTCPQAFTGKALGIMGAAVETQLDSQHAVGSVSGHLYQKLPAIIRSHLVLPPVISSIDDYPLKYLVILRLALAEPNITYAGTPNPSTLLRLVELMNQHRDELTHSLNTGTLERIDHLTPPLREQISQPIQPAAARAAEINHLPELTIANVWPKLKLLTTWMSGSCGIALDALRSKLPASTTVMELGYQSSEFRGSIALHGETPAGLPPIHHYLFEFVEQSQWDNGNPQYLSLEQIVEGKLYYVIITTVAGLYRYFMNDLVEVCGHFNATPLLRFVQKGIGVTNLCGEKLYENQVITAIQQTSKQHALASVFYILVAEQKIPGYHLFIELQQPPPTHTANIAGMIDKQLGQLNIEYKAKRDSGRLAPLTITWLKRGTGEAYKTAYINQGKRESQYKTKVLQDSEDLLMSLENYASR